MNYCESSQKESPTAAKLRGGFAYSSESSVLSNCLLI